MSARSLLRTLTWSALIAIGCSGGGGSGCGSGGCGGCGGSCLAPIPGGFQGTRQVDGAAVKLSQNGFNFVDTQAAALVVSLLGTSLNNYPIPCEGPISFGSFVGGLIGANGIICAVSGDSACSAADNDPNSSQRLGGECQADIQIDGVTVTPSTNMDGSVNVDVSVNLTVNTGEIPIQVNVTSSLDPGGSACGLVCDAQYLTPANSPIPITLDVNLSIDPTYGNLLAFNITNLSQVISGINTDDLSISSGGSCFGSFGCSAINNSTVKGLIFQALSGQITPTLQAAVDGFRCQPCDATNNNACPTGSTCDTSVGLCYIDESADTCPPAPLGIEGQLNAGSLLGTYGAPPNALLNVSVVAGGKTQAPNPASTYVQNGGLQLGFMGGTQAPQTALCAPPATWTAPPPTPQMDFDAELSLTGPGTNLSSYDVGIAISDDFLNKSLFDAWQAGVLCLDVTGDNISLLSSASLGLFLTNLPALTHGDTVPMGVALRPQAAPLIRVGRGTAASGATSGDPIITLEMNNLDLDFYALIEERYARLFTLNGNLLVQIALDFDPTSNTVTPSLATACMQNTPIENDTCAANAVATVSNNDMNVAADSALAAFLPGVLPIVTGALGGALGPIALPAIEGLQLQVLGARGSIMKPDGPGGYEQLAIYAGLGTPAPMMMRRRHTSAELTRSFVPAIPKLVGDDGQVTATIALDSSGPAAGIAEYSYRIDKGFWSPWTAQSELVLNDVVLRYAGMHDIEVRSRLRGSPETVDDNPAHVSFPVDYLPPHVSLAYDSAAKSVVTQAHDDLTPDGLLKYRYSVAGGPWSAPGPAQSFDATALGVQPSLRVEVADAAGHVGRAQFGASIAPPPPNPLAGAPTVSATHAGCSQTGVGPWAVLGLLVLAARRRRAFAR